MGTHPIFESDFDCLTEMLGLRLAKNARRFLPYSSVQVSENTDGFEILINSRKLRVPRTSEVVKVKSKDIAEIVALEWAGQKHRDLTMIQKHTLYMTQLCFAEQELAETTDKVGVIEEMLKYLQTDTCLFRSPVSDSLESLDGSPGAKLCKMQNEQWGPIKTWFEQRFDVKMENAQGFKLPTVPEEAFAAISEYLNSYDVSVLIIFEKMCLALKSMMLSVMVVERQISVEEAVRLSRLEDEYQKEMWGSVEYHHPVVENDLNAKVAAQALFIRFSVEDVDSDPKLISDFVL